MLEDWRQGPAPRGPDVAFYYILLGEPERAISALERGLEDRSPMMAQLRVVPRLDPLRDQARFQRLVRQMRLP